MVNLSVVIPTFNNEKTIELLLRSLDAAPKGIFKIKEILVVDGGSRDRTLKIITEFLSSKGYNYRIYTNIRRRGNAREFGQKHSVHDYICMFDADLFLDKNWFLAMSKAFEKYPDFDVLYGRVRMPQDMMGVVPKLAGIVYDYHYDKQLGEKSVGRPACDTSNTIFTRKILKMVDGFDSKLPFGEDADISFRILNNGGKMIVLHDAIAYHYHRPTLLTRSKQKFTFGYGEAFLHKKYKTYDRLKFWRMYFLLPYSTPKLLYKLGKRHRGLGVLSAIWYPVDQVIMLFGFFYAYLDRFKKMADEK